MFFAVFFRYTVDFRAKKSIYLGLWRLIVKGKYIWDNQDAVFVVGIIFYKEKSEIAQIYLQTDFS